MEFIHKYIDAKKNWILSNKFGRTTCLSSFLLKLQITTKESPDITEAQKLI